MSEPDPTEDDTTDYCSVCGEENDTYEEGDICDSCNSSED